MQKIVPHLWYDKEAKQAAEFYTSLFPDSEITQVSTLHDTPSGDCDLVSFRVWGHEFMAISAGPLFAFNPSISMMVNFDPAQDPEAQARIDQVWEQLIDGGEALMPIGKYPFSERYGWLKDKYGLSWQLILTDPEGEKRPPLIPSLLFTGEVCGKAEEATDFYMSVFKDAKRGQLVRYGANHAPDKEGSVMFSDFTLAGQWFTAMDSAHSHGFAFNEALSLLIRCEDQAEIDYFWEKLSFVPGSEQCGWLKDKYGVSWQVAPKAMDEMMSKGTPEQIARLTRAFLQMKKFEIAELQKAYDGE